MFAEDAILFSEIVNHIYLVAIHPASKSEREELQRMGIARGYSAEILGTERPATIHLASAAFSHLTASRVCSLRSPASPPLTPSSRGAAPANVDSVGSSLARLRRLTITALPRRHVFCSGARGGRFIRVTSTRSPGKVRAVRGADRSEQDIRSFAFQLRCSYPGV